MIKSCGHVKNKTVVKMTQNGFFSRKLTYFSIAREVVTPNRLMYDVNKLCTSWESNPGHSSVIQGSEPPTKTTFGRGDGSQLLTNEWVP